MMKKAMDGLSSKAKAMCSRFRAGAKKVGGYAGGVLALALASVVPAHATGNFSGSANTIPDLSGTLSAAHDSAGAAIETYGPALAGILFLFLVFRFAWNRLKSAVH
jgi:hypothetical protein